MVMLEIQGGVTPWYKKTFENLLYLRKHLLNNLFETYKKELESFWLDHEQSLSGKFWKKNNKTKQKKKKKTML